MRDEPLPKAAALVRSSLLERGAAVEVALRPLDRAALAAVARRAATRPLPPGALVAIERSAAGNPFFAEELAASVDASGEVTVPPRLREVVARRLERLEPLGERLLAALAVIDDGFTGAELAALAGAERVDEALGEAEAAGVLECVRGRYRFRHALVREELAARLPEEALRRTPRRCRRAARRRRRAARGRRAPPAARRPRAGGRPAPHPGRRVGRRRGRLPRRRRVGRAGARARGRARAPRPACAARAAAPRRRRGRAPAAYAEAIAVAPAERVPALRAQQARACLAAGDIPGAKAALDGVQAERPEDLGELIVLRGMVAWHAGDWDERAPAGRRGGPARARPGRARDAEGHGRPPRRRLGAALPARSSRTPGTRRSSRAASSTRYLCVTEYVLTAGDPYDRVAGFAKRLRAQAHQAGARRGEAFAATVLGETELFTGNLEAARAHLVDAARLSREVGAVGGESLARMRLGEALLHLGDRAGARAQLEEALELAHISTLAQHLLFLVYGVLLQVPEESAEALALIERAETLFDPRWVCQFCPTGYHVAAATVCARAGQPERAREFLERAEQGAARWLGGPWPAAVAEARAELLLAEGDERAAAAALRRAAEGYAAAGQLLSERRAREGWNACRDGDRRLGRFREGVPATLPACKRTPHTQTASASIPRSSIATSRRCTATWPTRRPRPSLPHRPAARRGARLPRRAARPAAGASRELVRRAWATTSASRVCFRASACSTSAAAPAWTCSRPPRRWARRLGHRRRHHARAARQVRAPAPRRARELPPRAHRGAAVRDGSFDAVISNGVVNLSADKRRVFAEAARVLRPGGRLALADIVTERRSPRAPPARPTSGPPASPVPAAEILPRGDRGRRPRAAAGPGQPGLPLHERTGAAHERQVRRSERVAARAQAGT